MIVRPRVVVSVVLVLSSLLVACGPQTRKVPNLSGAWLGTITVTSSERNNVLVADAGLSIDDQNATREYAVDFSPKVNAVTFLDCLAYDQVRSSDSVVALETECSSAEIANAFCLSGLSKQLRVVGTVEVTGSTARLSATGGITCDAATQSGVAVSVTGSFSK